WSFTVEPYAYPVTNVTATASGSAAGMEPQNTVNGSGLDDLDQHSASATHMWMSAGTLPAWIQFEFDAIYKLDEMWVWNSNQLIENLLGFGAKDVAIEYSTDGETWAALDGVPEFSRAPGSPTYTANTTIDLKGIMARYVKLTINSNWGGMTQQTGLSEVRFFYVPTVAREPVPTNGATDVSVEAGLDWRPGRETASHVVYLGTDSAAVAAGTVPSKTVTEHGYSPADLAFGTQYFWRVDEIESTGTYTSDVWSFSTEPYAVIEDFESYNDDNRRIYQTWIDGVTDGSSGSQVGYNESPFAERTVVHGGKQSMPLIYNNASFAFSQTTRTFDEAQDWTAHGVKTLSLHFAGTAENTGRLYVKIGASKVLYDGDATDVARAGWQAWNIDLSAVNGVGSVDSLTIGIEGSGAAGTLYIDDIRLSPKPPEFLTPVEPASAGLIARYAFEGNVQDSSGKGRNGAANGGPTYVPGMDGQALYLDGVNDYVVVGSVGISGAAPRTISGWAKAKDTAITDWTTLFGFTSTPDVGAAMSFDIEKIGGTTDYGIHAYGWERSIMPIDLEWHHLAATYDGTTIAWYGDGFLVASEAWTLDTQDNVQMGKRGHAAGGNFPGTLDEVRIYNKALSAEEIAWLAGRRLPVHLPQ
ncbi:MAG: LamG-like jellyroll fold domain-containing protein, partial [Solirubrobacterales bacterium]